MKRPYLNPSASFGTALIELVKHCREDLFDIQELRAKMKWRLDEAAAVQGIDPAAVLRLLKMQQENDISYARQEEIDAAYRAIVTGALPVAPSRVDAELDKVMQPVTNNKPPKIDDITTAISCSRGKAHKLRSLAAARLAAKSSCSSKLPEHELPARVHVAVTPGSGPLQKEQEEMLRRAADRERTLSLAEAEPLNAPLDTSNVVSLPRSD